MAQSIGQQLMMVARLSTDHASFNSDKSLIGNETQSPNFRAVFLASAAGPCVALQLMP